MNSCKCIVKAWAPLGLLLALMTVLASYAHADGDNGNIFDKIMKKDTSDSFDGTWDTVTAGVSHFVMVLKQDGKKVTGKYMPGNGKVEGKIKDGSLDLKWSQDGSKGTVRMVLSKDGQWFNGISSNDGDAPTVPRRSWNGCGRWLPPTVIETD